jgi:hypothetical protein
MNSTSNPFPDLPKPFPVRLEDLYDPAFSDGLSPSEHLERLYGRVSPPLPTEEVAKLLDWIRREAVHGPCADEWRLAAKLLSAGASEQLGAIAGPAEAPTDKDLEAKFCCWYKDEFGSTYFGAVPLVACIKWTKFALARYGRPTFQPIPVSRRLPGPDELEASFRDWWKDRHGSAGLGAVPLAPFIIEWTQFALTRFYRPALEPTTKGNRPILKSNPFHNEDGECWCFESADGEWDVPASWHLRVPYHTDEYFLPHYHFPVPSNHD